MVNCFIERFLFLSVLCCMSVAPLRAQYNGLLQRNDLTDVLRAYQILDSSKTQEKHLEDYSFTIRPINPFAFEDPKKNWIMLRQFGYSLYKNDSIARGYNNESFFQAAGMQRRYTAGVALKLGRLIAEFQPEWVMAENTPQHQVPEDQHYDPNFYTRYFFWNINVIDLPSRFGTEKLDKFYLGQSSVKIAFNHFAFGFSNENIWWGPGLKNSLVMTNNANGFKHLTLHTIKPLKMPLGKVEAQLIIGNLDSSGVEPVEFERQRRIYWADAYIRRPNADRRMMGFVMTYQPKWMKNLYLGVAGTSTFYRKPMNEDGTSRVTPYTYVQNTNRSNDLTFGSVFFRYAMPKDKAEIYGEFGRSDKLVSPFNIIADTIPFGFVFGLRKWAPISKRSQIELAVEVAQLQMQDPRLIMAENAPWGFPRVYGFYAHPTVRHGHTQNGQMLGAGIGPGSNSQFISLSYYREGIRVGVHGERVVNNNDFNYAAYLSGTVGRGWHNRYYVDLVYGAHAQVKVGGIYLSGAINYMNILNYQWVKLGGTFNTGSPLSDKKNVQASLAVLYDLNLKQTFRFPKPIQKALNWLDEKAKW